MKNSKNKNIDILKVKSTSQTKWSRLPIFYKILLIILAIVLLFIPVLMLPKY